MRLLFLTTGLARGGAETQLTQLALRLKARGWAVKVVSIMPPRAYADRLQAAGIPVVTLGVQSKTPDPRPIFHLIREIRQWHPHLVHSFMVHANLLARLIRPLVEMPVLVCSARNVHEGGALREWLYRMTDPLCTFTTQVSREGRERYIRIRATPAHKIEFIPNGVDTHRFFPNIEIYERQRAQLELQGTFLWLAVGRLVPQKDFHTLLHAFAEASARFPDTQLWIAGDGPERSELERLAQRLNLQSRVRFLGLRKDIPDLMRIVDAFVLSSAWEGMPNVVLEAAASGLPVVSTQVSGVGDIVLAEKTGYLVPPGDPNALADAMLRLMHLPEPLRRQMGQRARKHVKEHFDLERIVDRWEDLYQRLLQKYNSPSRD